MATAAKQVDLVEQVTLDIPDGALGLATTYVPHAHVHPDPEQPRVDADDLLRASVLKNGILQAITVRPHPTRAGEYMIVDGERRWSASDGLLELIPVQIRHDQENAARRLVTQLVANTGKPLTPIEEARAYARILNDGGLTMTELSALLGTPRSTIGERLILVELGPWIPFLESGQLPVSHAVRALGPLRNAPDAVHAVAISEITDDIAFDEGITYEDFRDAVRQAYRDAVYPLAKSKADHEPQPLFNTTKHDAECACGTVAWPFGWDEKRTRKACINPDWWKPLHEAAEAERKAKEKVERQAQRQAGRAATADDGPSLVLPKGVKKVKAQYGNLPAGVVQLTTPEGRWNVARHVHDRALRLDPADLGEIDARQLVEIPKDWRGQPYAKVGTQDTAAIERAAAAWRARFAKRRAVVTEKVRTEIARHSSKFAVASGSGTSNGMYKLLETVARHHGADVRDLAEVLGYSLPPDVAECHRHELGGKMAAWLKTLDNQQLDTLATAFATAAGRDIALVTERVDEEEMEALREIAGRRIPWLPADAADSAAAGLGDDDEDEDAGAGAG